MEVESKEEVERANGSKNERKVRQAPDWSESRRAQNAGTSERKRGAMGRTEWSRMNVEDKKDWPGGVKDR